MIMKTTFFIFIIITALLIAYTIFGAHERPVTLMATTTTEDSGLLNILIPELEKDTGLDIQVITFGTGKVLRSAMDGNADVILVHDPISEEIFMKEGFGSERLTIMRNDFVLLGPKDDPAAIRNAPSLTDAFQILHLSNEPFVSRGDQSGTHKSEMRIWQAAGYNSDYITKENYIITGAGMGQTLNIAVEKQGYILTDRATWITFQNKGDLVILKANDPLLINIYSLLNVNANLHEHISQEKQDLIFNWFKSEKSKKLINGYKYSNQHLFNALINTQLPYHVIN